MYSRIMPHLATLVSVSMIKIQYSSVFEMFVSLKFAQDQLD